MQEQATVPIPVQVRMDILELMALYAWAYDTDNAERLRDTFTPDGVLEVFGNVLAGGRIGFEEFIATAREMKDGHGWQHLADHHVFRDYDGTCCTVYSYYALLQGNEQGADGIVRAMGYYVSRCVLTAAGWRFAHRSVVRWTGKAPF